MTVSKAQKAYLKRIEERRKKAKASPYAYGKNLLIEFCKKPCIKKKK